MVVWSKKVRHYRMGFPTWGAGTPWECQTLILGVSDSFPGSNTKKIEIWCPATFVADLNFDQLRWECQRSTRIDGGVSGQNKARNHCSIGIVNKSYRIVVKPGNEIWYVVQKVQSKRYIHSCCEIFYVRHHGGPFDINYCATSDAT